jgi:hypothetical protein
MAIPKIPPVSPFPKASVARILDPHADKLGATLVARQLGYLAVKVTFHKQPLDGLEVKFYEAEADGSKGAQVGGKTFKTDLTGRAWVDYLVDAGVYVVEIEKQTSPALVSTVSDLQRPYVVPLPVNRPYFDFDEQCEFDDQQIEVTDYVPAPDDGSDADDPADAALVTDALGLDQWGASS